MSNNKKPTISNVISKNNKLGDVLADVYYEDGDLKVAQLALKAYSNTINAAKTQVIYKKGKGTPGTIPFLEE